MRGRGLVALFLLCWLCACTDPPAKPPTTQIDAGAVIAPPHAIEYATDDASWRKKFHSKRFQVSVPLPDGSAWKIDDHSAAELVAVHAATNSKLSLIATQEENLMNRQRCEERAHALGMVPAEYPRQTLTTLEDQVYVGPDAYDARIWVALDPGKADGTVEGHIFYFGAFLRRCLLIHLTTSIASSRDEEVLASRLAIGNARIIKGIAIDPLRTTDDAVVPRDKPDIHR